MVEGTDALNVGKRFFGMASCAVASEFIFMDIHMATDAPGMRDVGKSLEGFPVKGFNFMAFFTANRFMFSYQWKVAPVMIEKWRRFEFLLIVAPAAVIGQSPLMIVSMAGKAGYPQPQKGFTFIL